MDVIGNVYLRGEQHDRCDLDETVKVRCRAGELSAAETHPAAAEQPQHHRCDDAQQQRIVRQKRLTLAMIAQKRKACHDKQNRSGGCGKQPSDRGIPPFDHSLPLFPLSPFFLLRRGRPRILDRNIAQIPSMDKGFAERDGAVGVLVRHRRAGIPHGGAAGAFGIDLCGGMC